MSHSQHARSNLRPEYLRMVRQARAEYEIEMAPARAAMETARVQAHRNENRKIKQAQVFIESEVADAG